jgi:hypothetical protein
VRLHAFAAKGTSVLMPCTVASLGRSAQGERRTDRWTQRVRPGDEWGRDASLGLGSTHVARSTAHGPPITGPPRCACTAEYGGARQGAARAVAL